MQGQRCCVLTPTMLPAETDGELTVKSSQSGLGATSLSQWSGQGWVCSGSVSLLLAAPVPSSVLPGQVGLCCLGLRSSLEGCPAQLNALPPCQAAASHLSQFFDVPFSFLSHTSS